jgi:hypothetical protein
VNEMTVPSKRDSAQDSAEGAKSGPPQPLYRTLVESR